MFKEQARRLLRTKWREPQKLAEELFAILSYEGPLTHRGTLKIIPDDGDPAIEVQIPGTVPEDPLITATHPPTEPGDPFEPIGYVPFVPDPDAPGTGGGFNSPDSPGGSGNQLPDRDDSGDVSDPGSRQDDPRATPVTTLGRVVSGSGENYMVGVWLNDPEEGDADYWMVIPAKVMQIDSGETVPVDSVVFVTLFYPAGRAGVVAYLQPPVVL